MGAELFGEFPPDRDFAYTDIRTRQLADGAHLFVNEAGRFFQAEDAFAARFRENLLSLSDDAFLERHGFAFTGNDRLGAASHNYAIAERLTAPGALDYFILVPTLRCNLDCSYCQVSRVDQARSGFDWSEETLSAVLAIIDHLPTDCIKIEFQGGEPTLRPDLMRAVIARCERFAHKQFVICTNLQVLNDDIFALLDRDDLFVSTSLDGDALTHERQRTRSPERTARFFTNLRAVIDRYGPRKVSALPTIDAASPPDIDALIDSFVTHGLHSIFLRPINFQGFARKRHRESREQDDSWRSYHERFVRRLIERNWQDRSRVLEETYLSICLRRIFQPGRERHVDLRNPNPVGEDYIVVDYDGTVYPTDEARMLSRSGVIDLAIGDVWQGWQTEARDMLNRHVSNLDDPTCRTCTYQAFCGRDLIDDIARYGRIDLPRHDTEFCRRHLHLFDFLFRLLYEDDPAVRYSLSRWLRLDGTLTEFGGVFA